ncbi:hypothetical protein MTR67_052811 [Solanum verrucosum]|uniref:Uncharacterized protein n=1 Tax=Solanum verrucosum TaxID=315347 RepID=A0AAF0V9V6_SOLVR|nr:hypothetical protein MTR67_052811 [Solanum verrucosum]
MVLHRGTVR